MHCYYDLYSWSKERRKEALREAQTRRLAKKVRANRRALRSGRASFDSTWGSVLSLLRRAALSE
jgi:hypothetical protein